MSDPLGKKAIHLLGICGTGVGALAGLLKSLGHNIQGSDEHIYPPMSDKLAQWGIEVMRGYRPEHLQPHPDLVIMGNIIRRDNPAAIYVRDQNLPCLSMPQAIAAFGIANKHALVVTGTHGKTSVTSLCAHVLVDANRDPSFLVGGALLGYTNSFRVGQGNEFVIEGDEYDTAYFDKGPKFLHYKAKTAIITSLEFDHADIFSKIEDIEAAFEKLISSVAPEGHLVVWHGAGRARRLVEAGRGARRVTYYAMQEEPGVDLWCKSYHCDPRTGITFEPILRGQSLGEMHVPLWGEFSALNVLATLGALTDLGLSPHELRHGLASHQGVHRRMEVIGEPSGITIVDDFAHHPTAIRETLRAARTRWPKRRLWVVFEPRSATNRRNLHQEELARTLAIADRVIIGSHERLQEIPTHERFDPSEAAASVAQWGGVADAIANPKDIAASIKKNACTGDVVMILSNGDFGGLHGLLLKSLESGEPPAAPTPNVGAMG